jgi:hypothetical protein
MAVLNGRVAPEQISKNIRHLCETLEGMVKEHLVKLVTLLHPLLKFEVKLIPPEHLLKIRMERLALLLKG